MFEFDTRVSQMCIKNLVNILIINLNDHCSHYKLSQIQQNVYSCQNIRLSSHSEPLQMNHI